MLFLKIAPDIAWNIYIYIYTRTKPRIYSIFIFSIIFERTRKTLEIGLIAIAYLVANIEQMTCELR